MEYGIQNRSSLGTLAKPEAREQQRGAELRGCGRGEGGVEVLGRTSQGELGRRTRMRTSPRRDAPFTYFGKTDAIGENGRSAVRPRASDLLGCLFIRLLHLPCLSVDPLITQATQTSLGDAMLPLGLSLQGNGRGLPSA